MLCVWACMGSKENNERLSCFRCFWKAPRPHFGLYNQLAAEFEERGSRTENNSLPTHRTLARPLLGQPVQWERLLAEGSVPQAIDWVHGGYVPRAR